MANGNLYEGKKLLTRGYNEAIYELDWCWERIGELQDELGKLNEFTWRNFPGVLSSSSSNPNESFVDCVIRLLESHPEKAKEPVKLDWEK